MFWNDGVAAVVRGISPGVSKDERQLLAVWCRDLPVLAGVVSLFALIISDTNSQVKSSVTVHPGYTFCQPACVYLYASGYGDCMGDPETDGLATAHGQSSVHV